MTDEAPKQAAHPRRVIEQEAAALDADSVRALRLARDRALNEGARATRRWPVWVLWPGAVAAGVVSVMLLMPAAKDGLPGGAGPESVIADLDVLAQEDDLGLIEDLEFLAWLSAQEEDLT